MKHALILGSTKGIGFALARQMLKEGLRVTITGRDSTGVAAALGRLDSPHAAGLVVDMRDLAGARAALAAVDGVDHLVLCGSSDVAWGAFQELDLVAVESALHMKLVGFLNIVQASLPKLAERASVTFVGGAASRAAMPGTVGLAVVNGGLEMATRTLARELAPRRVNLVSPGLTDTESYDQLPAAAKAGMFAGAASKLPVGRTGLPEEIAAAISMVALNPFMTGAVVDVDGGAHLG